MFVENSGNTDYYATNTRFGYFTRRKCCVLKFGGSLASDDLTVYHIAQQVWQLQKKLNLNLVVVHGGGVLIDEELKKRGQQIKRCPRTNERITDRETLDVCDQVLTKRNAEIVNLFNLAAQEYRFFRPRAVALCGYKDAFVLGKANDNQHDLSGQVLGVNDKALTGLLATNTIAIVNPLGVNMDASAQERRLNLNADDIALAIAQKIGASGIIYCSSVHGVMSKNNRVIHELTTRQCERLIKDGTIKGGMIPKVTAAAQAAEKLKDGCVILNGGLPRAILNAVTRNEGGTRFRRENTGYLPAVS